MNFAVEQFMKRYYRTAQQVSTLNEMLLAYFNESVITLVCLIMNAKLSTLMTALKL